jgi:2-polyprenyl-3-methyl-5-hydroxy-6-metoxy-1,4-benzoquinol methylase
MYCSKCGLGYFLGDDAKVKKAYAEFYKNDYWHGPGNKGKQRKREASTIVDKLRRFALSLGVHPLINISHYEIIKDYVADGSLLDIGCGQGDALKFFSSKGYDVCGIEPDSIKAEKINSCFKKKVCYAEDAETFMMNGKYDIIYVCHVLEHLVSPLSFLKRIKNNLGKNSILFVEVPNCQKKEMMKISTGMESHAYHFTMQSLLLLFRKAGYDIVLSGVYDDISPNQFCSFFRSLLKIPSYKKASLSSGKKIIIIARL